jgi:hypothetical protein
MKSLRSVVISSPLKVCDNSAVSDNKGTYTPMFVAALFTKLIYGNSQDAPILISGLKNVVLYTMEFYSATEKNEILSFANKLLELKNILLSQISQVQKVKGHMASLICRIQT